MHKMNAFSCREVEIIYTKRTAMVHQNTFSEDHQVTKASAAALRQGKFKG